MSGPYKPNSIPVEDIDETVFFSRIDYSSDGCWPWVGPVHFQHGRPRPYLMVNKKRLSAKRIAWVIENQVQVPDGLVISQSCGDPLCMKHLVANTQSVAVSRGMGIRQREKAGL
jgi:hypothetical protein